MNIENDHFFSSEDNIDSLLSTIDGLYQLEQPEQPSAPSEDAFSDVETVSFTGDYYSVESLEEAGFNEPQIAEIHLGLEMNLPVAKYAKLCYTWKQMMEIRLGLHAGIDTSLYENHLYSVDQMRELRMGIMNHVNASLYAKLMLSATDMRQIRLELSAEAYRKHPNGYAYHFTDENSGLVIRISDDCMSACITLPSSVKDRFSVNRIVKILKQHEITFGLLEQELEYFSKELPRDREVLIAQGHKSTPGVNGSYEYFFNRKASNAPRIREDGTVDYSSMKVTETVQAGQVVAVYHPATTGVTGSTVTGISLTPNVGQDLPALTGEGISFDKNSNTYRAVYGGNITFQEQSYSLNIWKTCTIEGDATRYSGNIEYDGTVIIRGDVRNMARIRATGDIYVDGLVEGAELTAGQNIIIRGGMNAAGRGSIQAGGNITGSFFEAANLKAGGTIEGSYFLSCNIETDDKVIAKGGKSLIQGGQIMAAIGVEASNYRAASGSKTKIEVGNTSSLATRQQEITVQMTKATDEIRKLRDGKSKLIQVFGPEIVETRAIYQKTISALEQKEAQLEQLELENERLERILLLTLRAYIKVSSFMQSGILIVVNGNRKLLEKDLKKLTITSEYFTEEEGDKS